MKDIDKGIEVRVRQFSSKHQYAEHTPAPQSPLHRDDRRHKLIIATTDEGFYLEVVVDRKFDFGGHRYVRALVEFDGGVRAVSKHIFFGSIRVQKDGGRYYTYEISKMKNYKDGDWRYFGFTFGELQVDSNIALSADQEAKQAVDRGTIKITLQRGRTVRIEEEKAGNAKPHPIPSLKTSEKVVKQHCKTHGFKRTIGSKTAPDTEKWAFVPAHGGMGRPMVYTFTYVSREILEANTTAQNPKKIMLHQPTVTENKTSTKPTAKNQERVKPKDDTTMKFNSKKQEEIVEKDGASNKSTSKMQNEAEPKQPTPVINLCDDEEHRPSGRIKIESAEEPTKPSNETIEKNPPPQEKVTISAEEPFGGITREKRANDDLTAEGSLDALEKEKKRARIMLKLEENRLKQELMDLDG